MNQVELNQNESQLLSILGAFEIDLNEVYEVRIKKLNTCSLLTQSLLERNAIPKVRLKYFANPEYNLGNKRKSKKQIFESRGIFGVDIFSQGTFLKYLKYFILGADLPIDLKSKMAELKNNNSYDSDFVEEAIPMIKLFYKQNIERMDKDTFVEEVYKHSLDLDIELGESERLRNALMRLK
jgi:hypothetical protein